MTLAVASPARHASSVARNVASVRLFGGGVKRVFSKQGDWINIHGERHVGRQLGGGHDLSNSFGQAHNL